MFEICLHRFRKRRIRYKKIELACGTEYFFVLEEVDLFTIFRIDRTCAQRLETFLHHIALDPQRTEESLLLLVELNKISTRDFLALLAKSRCSRLCQQPFTSTSSRLRGCYRVRKTRGKRPLLRAKLLGMRKRSRSCGLLVNVVSVLAHCSAQRTLSAPGLLVRKTRLFVVAGIYVLQR